MLSDHASSAKYLEVKGQQKTEKDGELYKQKRNAINQPHSRSLKKKKTLASQK